MANQHTNKVVVNGRAIIDLTGDTVDAAHLASGVSAHDKSGKPIAGTAALVYDASSESLTLPNWAVELG